MELIDSSADGPANAFVGRPGPTWIAENTSVRLRCPSARSIHPVRIDELGAARSISSIALKCERLAVGWPTACTAPNDPLFQ